MEAVPSLDEEREGRRLGRASGDVPDGIIGRLMRECGGNVRNCRVLEVTFGAFEKETRDGDPYDNPKSPRLHCQATTLGKRISGVFSRAGALRPSQIISS